MSAEINKAAEDWALEHADHDQWPHDIGVDAFKAGVKWQMSRTSKDSAMNSLVNRSTGMKYRKKPVVIDAWKYDHGLDVSEFEGVTHCVGSHGHVQTLEGEMQISTGDYLIRGVKGEYYPCKPDIFEQTYERITDQKSGGQDE